MIRLEDITSYKLASEISDYVWNMVDRWPILAKKTIGDQLIRSTDSIAANIAEAEGRYFKKDKMRFLYQARGSLFESYHWIERSNKRKLINDTQYEHITKVLKQLPKEINFLISNISKNLQR